MREGEKSPGVEPELERQGGKDVAHALRLARPAPGDQVGERGRVFPDEPRGCEICREGRQSLRWGAPF